MRVLLPVLTLFYTLVKLLALISPEMWGYSSWIDQTKAAQARVRMSNDNGVPYGGLESYYHMCRFNSGFFFRHPLLQEYDYYWRVEPHVEFFCDIDYDPFAFIQKHNISYGFTISLKERPKTIPTLWQHVKQFIKDNPQYLSTHNSATFISDSDLTSYNLYLYTFCSIVDCVITALYNN